jgi:Ca2+-binding RTX toxin-like protein
LTLTADQIVNNNHLRLRLSSSTGVENVMGSPFADQIYGNSRDNFLNGSGGADTIFCRDGADQVIGDEGDDWLYGENGDDWIYDGYTGNDHLYGGQGNDNLIGTSGNDNLYGEGGLDALSGGADNDLLDGGFDGLNDLLDGGAGADTFVRHRRLYPGRYPAEETLSDYAKAVDAVMTVWH